MRPLLILLAALTSSCKTIPTPTEAYDNQLSKNRESAEEAYHRFSRDFSEKIKDLDNAGKGSIRVCDIKSYENSIAISYDNRFGKRVLISTHDRYSINSISLYMNKTKTESLLNFLNSAELKSSKHKKIEDLELGIFRTLTAQISFSSRRGNINAFWVNNSGDRILTDINTKQIIGCINYILPNL